MVGDRELCKPHHPFLAVQSIFDVLKPAMKVHIVKASHGDYNFF